jgi:hypothetical protein
MAEFKRYVEVEPLHKEDVEGILCGRVWVFPKLDGANSSIFLDEKGVVTGGSRNRALGSGAKDNHGFREAFVSPNQGMLTAFFNSFPNVRRVYGEWLVPHTLRTYREDAWRKFYLFDVETDEGFLPYEEYSLFCAEAGFNVVPALSSIENPTEEYLRGFLERNTFLIEDGKGYGEGVVVKNYGFRNKFGHRVWGKIVRNEFKEQMLGAWPTPEAALKVSPEAEIALNCVTAGRLDKIIAKIPEEERADRKTFVPRLLNTAYHEVVTEELWDELKRLRNPVIDFKALQGRVFARVKELRKEVFA